jgi:hypothetical protein
MNKDWLSKGSLSIEVISLDVFPLTTHSSQVS